MIDREVNLGNGVNVTLKQKDNDLVIRLFKNGEEISTKIEALPELNSARVWKGSSSGPTVRYNPETEFIGIKKNDFYLDNNGDLYIITVIKTNSFTIRKVENKYIKTQDPPATYIEGGKVNYTVGDFWFNQLTQTLWYLIQVTNGTEGNKNYEWICIQDKLIAGNNITISADGKTISATDTTYSAGDGIDITSNTITAKRETDTENLLTINPTSKGLQVEPSSIYSNSSIQTNLGESSLFRQTLANTQSNYPLASKSYVDGLMSGAVKRQIVSTLPTTDIDTNTIYMIPKTTVPQTNNAYDEYMYINNAWEKIGDTEVDLTYKPNLYTGTGKPSETKSSFSGIKIGDLYVDISAATQQKESVYIVTAFSSTAGIQKVYWKPSNTKVFYGNTPYATYTDLMSATNLAYISKGTMFVKESDGLYVYTGASGSNLNWDKVATATDLSTKQGVISVTGHLTKNGNTLGTTAITIYKGVYNNGELSLLTADYPGIKENDLIRCDSSGAAFEVNNYYFKHVIAVDIGEYDNEIAVRDIKPYFYINGTPPSTAAWGENYCYSKDDVCFSNNGNIYICSTATWNDNTETWSYTWQEYKGTDTTYTFTNGLTESSGAVEVDIASGSKLLIDSNNKLDVDLSTKQDTIDSSHKLSADNVDDTNSTNKFVTATDKQNWNNKQDFIDSSNPLDADYVDDSSSNNKFVPSSTQADAGKQLMVSLNGDTNWEKVFNAPPIELKEKGNSIILNDGANEKIEEIKIMGKSIQNGTPTIANPVDIVDTTSESIDIRNKNLFDINEVSKSTVSKGYCTIDVDGDTISLTANRTGQIVVGKVYSSGDTFNSSASIMIPVKAGCSPRISFKNNVFDLAVIYFFDKNGNYISNVSTNAKPNFNNVIAPANTDFASLAFAVSSATENEVYTDSIQLEYDEVTEYVSPVTPQIGILSKTLRGIPVTSNGNYTDPSGQQWYCDTIEKYKDGTGKYIQRLFCMVAGDYSYAQVTKGSETGNNTFSVRWNTTYQTAVKLPSTNSILKSASLYSHGTYGSIGSDISSIAISSSGSNMSIKYGVTLSGPSTTEAFETWFNNNTPVVVYPIETPIETPLTAEELAQLDLSTLKPTTVINSTPDVEITYVADTKNYIDNKFNELQNLLLAQNNSNNE